MKQMKTWLQHLRQCCALKGHKTGSSLGMVMIVGTALVIWVMAIMPLMTTTGTTAIKTQSTQDDYLTARSSIEFSKSELEKIVETQIPYTFAVLKDDSGKFSALPKKDGIITNPAYQACIVEDATDDTKDVPEAGDAGANVAAICAAKLNPSDSTQYLLTITTFTDGEKNLSYSAVYTLNGSLLIYPESYKQSQALPLSDFVLVDGKLGNNQVWYSDIAWNASSNATYNGVSNDSSYTEILRSWKIEPDEGYADSGEYPAVFKKTALAALDGETVAVGSVITEDPLTDASWVKPVASTKEAVDKSEGAMWIDFVGGFIKVYVLVGENAVEVTASCDIYFNGEKRTAFPTNSGKYIISVDYAGTGSTYKEEAGAINVLPIKGAVLGNYEVDATDKKFDATGCKITNLVYNGDKCTVTLSSIKGAWYGYTNNSKTDGSDIEWQTSNEIEVSTSETWYFYCYCPADIVEGVWYDNSDVVYAGMVYPFEAVTELEHGKEYIVIAKQDNKYYAMDTSVGTVQYPRNTSANTQYVGELNAGVITADVPANLAWTMVKTEPTKDSSTWQFVAEGKIENEVFVAEKVLNVTRKSLGNYSLTVGNITSDSNVNIDFEKDGRAAAYRAISSRYDLYVGYDKGGILSSAGFKAGIESRDLYFIEKPAEGVKTIAVPIMVGDWDKDISYIYNQYNSNGENNWQQIKSLVSQATDGAVIPEDIYLNGEYVSYDDVINAGTYELVGYTSNSDWKFGEEYYKLGTLTVSKASLNTDYSPITITQNETDELKVTVSGSNWNGENGGTKYIGYQSVASDGTKSEMKWFEMTDTESGSINFRLNYGQYLFALAESGSNNYLAESYLLTDEVFPIEAAYVELTDDDKSSFVYKLDRSDINNIKVTWYGTLPEKITPSKITMAYGIPDGTDGITWSTTYSSDVRFYGALIKGTDFEELPHVFQLSQPLGVTNENGHFSSLMRGSSLYFMGEENSINTFGNDIYLHADSLVLKNPVTGGGRVIVNPYSTGEDDPRNTLVFFVNAMGNFEAKNFYLVPAGTDLNNVSATNAAAWKCVDEDGQGTVGTDFADKVKYYFRNKVYPEINLDIAYASKDQLKCIVSSETIGWTVQGKLSGKSDITNTGYVVCAYVTEITDITERKANRILIAAKAADNSYTLNVPKDLKFTTRYLSVDADTIVQSASGVKFELYNLAQDQNFISIIKSALGLTNYSSKTLQMDYERHTNIVNSDGTMSLMKSEVCRYDDGTNLFVDCSKNQQLLATYTTSEIEDLFTSGWSGTVKTINRYMAIECDKPNGKMSISAIASCYLDMYANYIYFDDSIDEISFSSQYDSDFKINSQESGYTAHEYLGWFAFNSAESYSGTLIYFADNVTVKNTRYFLWWPTDKTEVVVEKGFYYIPASDEGTTLLKLASHKDEYKINEESLKNYSVYIDPETGSLSNAYVDTGIFDNSTVGLGGFSGGSMK